MKARTAFLMCLMTGLAFADVSEKLVRASQLFDEAKYPEASSIYREILAESPSHSGDVHFNLGSSYFREGRLGESIYHFRKAVELRPRDADARFNLSHVRSKAVDRIEPKWDLFALLREKTPLNSRELLFAALGAWALFWIFATVLLFRSADVWRVLRFGSGAFSVVFLGLWLIQITASPYGVVTSEQSQVYSATGRDNVVLFELHRGAEFNLVSVESNWVQLELDDGKRGWISRQSVVLPEGPKGG